MVSKVLIEKICSDIVFSDNLKYSLIPNIVWTLTILLEQVDSSMPGLQKKLFLVLHSISCDGKDFSI